MTGQNFSVAAAAAASSWAPGGLLASVAGRGFNKRLGMSVPYWCAGGQADGRTDCSDGIANGQTRKDLQSSLLLCTRRIRARGEQERYFTRARSSNAQLTASLVLSAHLLVRRSPLDPSRTVTDMLIADGGCLDNPSIISMLQRRPKRLVIFGNFQCPLSPPVRVPRTTVELSVLSPKPRAP